MKDTYAVDILDLSPPLSLEPYNHVLIERGKNHLTIELRDGEVHIRGSRNFIIRPHVGNVVSIEFDK